MADRSATVSSTNSSRKPYKHSDNSESEGATGCTTSTTATAATMPLLCRFYLRGNCAFGERCHYIHDNDTARRNNSCQRSRNMSSNSRRMNNKNQVASNNTNTSNTNQPSTSGQTKEMASNSLTSSSGKTDMKQNAQVEESALTPKISTVIIKPAENDSDDDPDDLEGACCSPPLKNEKWVNAPEFVPKNSVKPKSYATAVNPSSTEDASNNGQMKLCPYAFKDGFCKYPAGECVYLHGDICDLCGCAALHPFSEEMRKKHNQECIEQHEKDMELSFAIARSKEKTCGVCFEIIMEKANGEQRFGILPNCNHCFCLSCIRKWRQARQFENNIIRGGLVKDKACSALLHHEICKGYLEINQCTLGLKAYMLQKVGNVSSGNEDHMACPECRVTSDFVCPSMYWVDTKEDKDKLILDYKKALAKKDCKYFKKGSGKCPFGNKCFYLHAFPDGSPCDVGPPPRQRRRRTAFDSEYEVLQQVILWDFLDGRDNPWQSLADDIEDLVELFTDSDESDWSDYDYFID